MSLYHFAPLSSLLNIIKTGTLRFTDSEYVSDEREFAHYLDPLSTAIQRASVETDIDIANHVYSRKDLYESRNEVQVGETGSSLNPYEYREVMQRFYLFCTTLSNDDLKMWSAYGNASRGGTFCIELDDEFLSSNLNRICDENGIDLFKEEVVYDYDNQCENLYRLILSVAQDFDCLKKSNDSSGVDLEQASYAFADKLKESLFPDRLFMKDGSFAFEKEFRYVLGVVPSNEMEHELRFGYDIGDNGKPKIFFELDIKRMMRYCVKTIWSLRQTPQSNISAIRTILDANGMQDTKIGFLDESLKESQYFS